MTVCPPEGKDSSSRALVLTSPPPQHTSERTPGNISRASAWMALAAALGIRLHICNVSLAHHGMAFTDSLVRMGIRIREEVVTLNPPSGNLDLRPSSLRGQPIPPSLAEKLSGDLGLIAVLAAIAAGTTHIPIPPGNRDDSPPFLRLLGENLRLMAASVEEHDAELCITGVPSLQGADLTTHGAPRLATPLALAALLAKGESTISHVAPSTIPFQNAWPDLFTVVS